MRKWFRWVLLVIVIILVAGGVYAYWRFVYRLQLRGDDLEKANTALSSGVTIDDNKNDFVMMETNKEVLNENNPSPYRVENLDVKSLVIGADTENLYYKVDFFAPNAAKPISINGDTLEAVGTKVEIMDDEGKDTVIMFADFGWWPILHVPVVNTYYATGPTGIEWPESARFTGDNRDSKVYGGAGTDYIIGSFPLKKMGLKYGDDIHLGLSMEAKSQKYTHAAVDVLQGKGKVPGLITWKIGANEYKINNEEHYFSGY